MPIPIACSCGRQFNAPDGLAGKSARCMYCGKSIPVPRSAPVRQEASFIAVRCPCGKELKAPPSLAGKKAKCPGCGAVLEIPAAAVEVVTLEAPAEEAPHALVGGPPERPVRHKPLTTLPAELPGPAIALAILGLLDTLVAGFIAFLFIAASAVVTLATRHIEAERKDAAVRQAPAEAALARLQAQGIRPTLNMTVKGADGKLSQRIEYTTREGDPRVEMIPLGEGPIETLTEDQRRTVEKAGTPGKIFGILGVVLGLVALGKIACSIGFFVRRGWGRSGLVGLAGLQAILVLVGVLTGVAKPVLLVSLAVNGAIFLYFLTPRVRAAC
jgi:hypothetical protein